MLDTIAPPRSCNRADETLEAIFASDRWKAFCQESAATFAKTATSPRPLRGSGHSPHAYRSTGFGNMRGKL